MKYEKGYDERSSASIESYAKRLVNHSIRDLKGDIINENDKELIVRKSKGSFGRALERSYFQISPSNNEGTPDFKEAGIELKSCPVRDKAGKLEVKERLVLGMIHFKKIATEEWESSSFIKKNGKLLLVFYLHEDGTPVIDLKVRLTGLWEFPAKDKIIIEADWKSIQKKVLEGRAHEISEGDTNYLRACTKDANSEGRQEQPCCDIQAKRRAFSLKPSYVNTIIDLFRKGELEELLQNSIIKNAKELKENSFEQVIYEKFQPYIGMTTEELAEYFNLKNRGSAKNFNDIITKKILKVDGEIEEFKKGAIIVRSIVLETTGRLKESISFPSFDYTELAKETDWEESKIREMFESRFFFVIYQKRPDTRRELVGVRFWTMPYPGRCEVRKVWELTVKKIRSGDYSNLPRISDNEVSHIRPHGRNAKDVVPTPDGGTALKRSFWLNARYMADQIGARPWKACNQRKDACYGSGTVVIR